ncbi:filament-like plant protein 4 [Tanacetum coccineum]|uniref:Filament-like plant protein 4 n=1 Tax=Tanacetum coccineum TaxID=301880 RepID=A0ABQ4YGW1_9ASTR
MPFAKELEIRNEEKNISVAEVANKQHLEGVMKIAKLEVECQRVCGLVRKKLPGPATLAQMKLEVDSLGRDYGSLSVYWEWKKKQRCWKKLAYSSNDSPRTKSCSDTSGITNNDQVAVGTDVEKPESDYSKKPNRDEDLLPLANLKSKVSDLLNSLPKDIDSEKLYEEISRAVQSSNNLESAGGKDEELTTAISRIYDFVSILGKEETCYVLQY